MGGYGGFVCEGKVTALMDPRHRSYQSWQMLAEDWLGLKYINRGKESGDSFEMCLKIRMKCSFNLLVFLSILHKNNHST